MRAPVMIAASLLALSLVVHHAAAERPPEPKESATHVVVGVLQQVDTANESFGGGRFGCGAGQRASFTGRLVVEKVERGDGVKAGDIIEARWFHVTRSPSGGWAGPGGNSYDAAKKGARVRAYLMKGPDGYAVLYNQEGIEAAK
jgi:hypothetical protein